MKILVTVDIKSSVAFALDLLFQPHGTSRKVAQIFWIVCWVLQVLQRVASVSGNFTMPDLAREETSVVFRIY